MGCWMTKDDEELLEKHGSNAETKDYLDFNPEVEFTKPNFELKVGQKFKNFVVFREILISASSTQGTSTFQIKSLKGEHICAREYTNKHVIVAYLSKKYQHKVRDDPNCSLAGIENDVRRDLMVDVSIYKVYRAKRKNTGFVSNICNQNFSQKFKGKELRYLFWAAASAGNEHDWGKAIEDIKKIDPLATRWLFELDSGTNETHVVDLDTWTCTCWLFQLTGIPCMHACAAIQKLKLLVENYVHKCYSEDTYLKVYAHNIGLVPSQRYWVKCNEGPVNAPTARKLPDKPKKMHRRAADEPKKGQVSTRKGLAVHCQKCFQPITTPEAPSQQPEQTNCTNPSQVSQPTTNDGNFQDAGTVDGQFSQLPEQPNCTNPSQVSQPTTNGGNLQGASAVGGQSSQLPEQPNYTNPVKFHNQLQVEGTNRRMGAKRVLEPSFELDNQVVVAAVARILYWYRRSLVPLPSLLPPRELDEDMGFSTPQLVKDRLCLSKSPMKP
ncbi:hypothetical protein ACH5RR_036891 [Cinchona calisaya]|uniref:SWIM-type domain-containing protein n=1 Tax=Cinchona calisaya TaxID=153742 RepID=A0ABD2Y991_9GENT